MGKRRDNKPRPVGQVARSEGQTIRSYQIGVVPILMDIFDRMNLVEILERHLPADSSRTAVPTAKALQLLAVNLLTSRQAIYGVGDWAGAYAPDLFGLSAAEVGRLQDDRIGRCLDRLFRTSMVDLVLEVVRHVVDEFALSLDELHNDSTSIAFHGNYEAARHPGQKLGISVPAITWGHSKDHRPDLKQLLYILTVTDDGSVPVFFTTASGNSTDDQTHVATWKILRDLVGSSDFLYVADCKLATTENMQYIDKNGGRFITVLPKTRRESQEFRAQIGSKSAAPLWEVIAVKRADDGTVVDEVSVLREQRWSKEKFRILWFRSTRKMRLDRSARLEKLERASLALETLQENLQSPRTRYRDRAKVEKAVDEILEGAGVQGLLKVQIEEYEHEEYKQATRGRPGKNTQYVKTVTRRFRITWEVDALGLAEAELADGLFPLITNQHDLSPLEVYEAYKRQPLIEKRFSQFKNDFAVAPVFLKSVTRIQALLAVYFFALMAQALLERQLRVAMENAGISTLPLYPEQRPCARPTTSRVVDVFEGVQRLQVTMGNERTEMVTELTRPQKEVLKLLGFRLCDYGRSPE